MAFLTWQEAALRGTRTGTTSAFSSILSTAFNITLAHKCWERMNGSVNKTKYKPQLMIAGGDLYSISKLCRTLQRKVFLQKTKWYHHHFIAFSSYKGTWFQVYENISEVIWAESLGSYNSHVPFVSTSSFILKVKEIGTRKVKQSYSGLAQVHRRAWTGSQAGLPGSCFFPLQHIWRPHSKGTMVSIFIGA